MQQIECYKRDVFNFDIIKKQKDDLENRLSILDKKNEEFHIMKDQFKAVIRTLIDVLEKIFILQINVTPDPELYYEMQVKITTRLFEINKARCGIDLFAELERLSHLQGKIQQYLKVSNDKNLDIPLEKIEEELEPLEVSYEVQNQLNIEKCEKKSLQQAENNREALDSKETNENQEKDLNQIRNYNEYENATLRNKITDSLSNIKTKNANGCRKCPENIQNKENIDINIPINSEIYFNSSKCSKCIKEKEHENSICLTNRSLEKVV